MNSDNDRLTINFEKRIKAGNSSSLSIVIFDQVNSASQECRPATCNIEYTDTGISIAFNLTSTVLQGYVEIKPQTAGSLPIVALSNTAFQKYPIKVENIAIKAKNPIGFEKSVTTVASAASGTIAASASAAPLLLSGTQPGSAFIFSKLVSEMLYLRLVDGVVSYYAELQLKQIVDIDVIPIETPGPFDSYGHEDRLKPSGNVGVLKYSTNILKNFGKELLNLLYIGALCGVISVSTGLFLSFKSKKLIGDNSASPGEPSKLVRVATVVYKSYGLRFFMQNISSVYLKLFINLIIGVSYSRANRVDSLLSTQVSYVLLFFMICFTFFQIRLILHIIPRLPEACPERVQLMKHLGDRDESLLFIWMSSPLEDLRVPRRRWMIWAPIVTLVRHATVAALLIGLAGTRYFQVISLIVVQVSYFAWTTTAGIKYSKYDNVKEVIDQGLELFYLTLKLWSLTTNSVKTQQETIGKFMMFTLMFYSLNTVLYILQILVMTVYDYIQTKRAEKIKLKENKYQEMMSQREAIVTVDAPLPITLDADNGVIVVQQTPNINLRADIEERAEYMQDSVLFSPAKTHRFIKNKSR